MATYTLDLPDGHAVQLSVWRRGSKVNIDVGEVVQVDVPPVEPPPADDHQRLQDLLTEVAALVAKLGSKA